MWKMVLGAVLALLLLAAGSAAFLFNGGYNVAATKEHTSLVDTALHTTMHASVEAHAADIEVPDLDDERMVRAGAGAYDDLCAACHLKPGLEGTVLRAGLNPQPPRLSRNGHPAPARQFWIIDNGIRMTGMPAWGVTHDDQAIWEIVAFLQRLPELTPADYQALVQPAPSAPDAAPGDGHDHEHGNTDAMARSPASAPADDGHDHEHGDGSALDEQQGDAPSSTAPATGHDNPATQDQPDEPADATPASDADHHADGHSH